MQLRSGRQKPANEGWVQRKRPQVQHPPPPAPPEEDLDLEFKPTHGDIIIRDVPHTSSAKVISALNVVRMYHDPDHRDIFNPHRRIKFEFRRGDVILRAGMWSWGAQSPFWFGYNNNRLKLYLYWPTSTNEPRWYIVAEIDPDPPEEPPPAADTSFPGPFVWSESFSVVRWDYIVHQEPDETVPWGRYYEVRVAPRRALDNDDVRNAMMEIEGELEDGPRLYGAGDIVVRIRRLNPAFGVQDLDQKFVAMFAYGFLCLGGQNQDVYTYRWRYLGMDQQLFRDYHSRNQVHPPPGLVAIQNPDTGHSPVRPGDVVFNLDRLVRKMWAGNNRQDTQTWLGGHVMLYPDGPVDEFSQNFYGSMILRLGTFSGALPAAWAHDHDQQQGQGHVQGQGHIQVQDQGLNFALWQDAPVQLFIQEQLTIRTRWIQVVQEEVRHPVAQSPQESGTFPPAHRGFKELFPNPAHIELGDKQINFQPCTSDLIVSTSIWDDHLQMVHGYPIQQGHEHKWVVRQGPPYPGDLEPRTGKIADLHPQIKDKMYRCFFWYPEYRGKDQDCLVRFGSEPADQRRDRGGNWVLGVEIYTFGLVTPLVWTLGNEPHYNGHWAFRGADRRVYPSGKNP